MDSFEAPHGDALPTLDPHTRSTIRDNVTKVSNREQRRAIEHTPFSIPELERALDRLKSEVVPGGASFASGISVAAAGPERDEGAKDGVGADVAPYRVASSWQIVALAVAGGGPC